MLEVKNLSKSYGPKPALHGVSFRVEQGEIVGFLGVNGAGKSTTMNIITGYLSATDGDILVDGIDVLTDPLKAKSRIGYLPEQPPIYPDMTVWEYLCFLYDLKKVSARKLPESKTQHLERILSQTGLTEVRGRLLRNLSKGYRQRAGFAGALLGDPPILILDEPTVGLDPAQIIEIRSLIRSLGKKHTILFSSHILSEVQAACDRIVIIHQGRIVADGTPEQLAQSLASDHAITAQVEGEAPRVKKLLSSLPGVLRVEAEPLPAQEPDAPPACRCTLETDGALSTRRQLFYTLAEHRLPLLSLSAQTMTLEEIFLCLTSQDAPAPEPSPEETPSPSDPPAAEPAPSSGKSPEEPSENPSGPDAGTPNL